MGYTPLAELGWLLRELSRLSGDVLVHRDRRGDWRVIVRIGEVLYRGQSPELGPALYRALMKIQHQELLSVAIRMLSEAVITADSLEKRPKA